jgi:hypothetical protein
MRASHGSMMFESVTTDVAPQVSLSNDQSVNKSAFERSRWRGGCCACDTPGIMGCDDVLNRLSPFSAKSRAFRVLQAKVDSIPIA